MEAAISSEFCRGYAAGHQAAQPEWISVDERLPECDGRYFTISEYLEGHQGDIVRFHIR